MLYHNFRSHFVRLAFVGNFHNHGFGLATTGTPIVYLLSEMKEVEKIDVYCPIQNTRVEETYVPDNVKIIPTFDVSRPFSILNLYKKNWELYDIVIFNLHPTAFGASSISNLIGLLIPIVLRGICGKNIRIVYHNSTLTNDTKRLGYNSIGDSVKRIILTIIEKLLFKSVETYFPLKLYVDRVRLKVSRARVEYLNMRYLEGLTTLYINGLDKSETITRNVNKKHLDKVLLHGYWGPQKNFELALGIMRKLKREGNKFALIVSGDINHNFPFYKSVFATILESYTDTIDEYRGYIPDKELLRLFLDADLLILPYNVPGGHSGVLEQGVFFDIPTIAVDFPEYLEQVIMGDNVKLTSLDNFYEIIKEALANPGNRNIVEVGQKIKEASKNIKVLIDSSLAEND